MRVDFFSRASIFLDLCTRYIFNIFSQPILGEKRLIQTKDFISIRIDAELKSELVQASDVERRSLSNFCRLLLEYAWGEYLKAGSMRNLLDGRNTSPKRSEEWRFKQEQ